MKYDLTKAEERKLQQILEASNYKYFLAVLAFQAGFMRGYGSAKYDAKKAKKG